MRTLDRPLDIKGSEWAGMSHRNRERLAAKAFHYWRDHGFPYYSLTPDEIHREFSNLAAQEASSAFCTAGITGSNVGLRLANSFHPQMWSVRVSRYLSPMDVFVDDQKLLTAIQKAWRLWPDRYGARPSTLRRILKTFPGTASVSNFRPTTSRALVRRYTKTGDTILDFSAGYGGRMLGCLSLGREYVGIEPCWEQVRGSRHMFEALWNLNLVQAAATVHHGCAEDLLPNIPSHTAALVLSSPPYYDWERYSDHSSQSFRRYETYGAWLSGFLGPVLMESRRILKPGGHLILNISGKYRRPEREDVERLATVSGLSLQTAVPMMLARIPYLHPRSGAFKTELLLIFRTQ